MTAKKKATKAKTKNKPKAIYFTENMARDLARIRAERKDPRLSDSVLIADAMTNYADKLETLNARAIREQTTG